MAGPYASLIRQFSERNPIYAHAVVTAYTVDGSFAKTATKATLYSDANGTVSTDNPFTLDANGQQPIAIYHKVDIFLEVDGVALSPHDIGVVRPRVDQSDLDTAVTNATTQATAAASSATAAASSASSASSSASSASTSATAASGSATNAATSATNAATSETNASNSASTASTASTAASTAQTAAEAAQTAAEAAQDAAEDFNLLNTTSTSSVTIGTGTKTFVVADVRGFQNGQLVKATDSADTGNWVLGAVTSWTEGTKTLQLNVTDTSGSGTKTSWNLNGSGPRGSAGAGSLDNIVEDATPQLGGDLDVNGQALVTTSNGDIVLSPNGTGEIDCQDKGLREFVAKDYAVENDNGSISSGTLTLDYRDGPDFEVTLTENITTLTISDWPASGKLGKITLALKQDATGGRSFPDLSAAAYKTPGGGVFTVSSGANDVDEIVLWTRDGGTTINWIAIGQDFT